MPKIFSFVSRLSARIFDNIKREYIISYALIRFLCAILFCTLIFCLFSLSSSAFLSGGENSSVFLVSTDKSPDGRITVTISTEGAVEVCGFITELTFDCERLIFTGADMPQALVDKGFFLSVKEVDGKISCIVDGSENANLNELVRFNFEPSARASDEVSSVDVSVTEAYFWDDGELVPLRGISSSVNVLLSGVESDVGLPSLLSSSVFFDGEGLMLELSGAFPKNCLAAGVDVFLADLSDFDASVFCISRVLPNGAEEKSARFSLDIPERGKLCIVVAPVSYSAKQTVKGVETVILIQDGKIIG